MSETNKETVYREYDELEASYKKLTKKWRDLVVEDHEKNKLIIELRKDIERAQWIIQINNEMFASMLEKRISAQFK
jgi:CHASE3 domain sensor protein